jgi:FKBP-type peptidyl-prolyl cis-trans isomerase (trigger factor)
MEDYKTEIIGKICYTDLVYERINKKLNIQLPKDEIEKMIYEIIEETDKTKFQKTGKNIYITNNYKNIRLTINSYTNRIITADRLNKKTSK